MRLVFYLHPSSDGEKPIWETYWPIATPKVGCTIVLGLRRKKSHKEEKTTVEVRHVSEESEKPVFIWVTMEPQVAAGLGKNLEICRWCAATPPPQVE
jgi:hypothetical protein